MGGGGVSRFVVTGVPRPVCMPVWWLHCPLTTFQSWHNEQVEGVGSISWSKVRGHKTKSRSKGVKVELLPPTHRRDKIKE